MRAARDEVPGPRLVHQAERPDLTGLLPAVLVAAVAEQQPAAEAHRLGQRAQVRDRLGAVKPAGQVKVDEGRRARPAVARAEPGARAHLAVRRGERVRQPEFRDRGGHAEQQQRFRLVGGQPAQREPVALDEAAPAAGTGLGQDGDARRVQGRDVPVDRAHGYLELGGELTRGHPPARLQQQGERYQAVSAHVHNRNAESLTAGVSITPVACRSMITWTQFTQQQPALAAVGHGQFYEHGLGLGFLATVRKRRRPPRAPGMPGHQRGRAARAHPARPEAGRPAPRRPLRAAQRDVPPAPPGRRLRRHRPRHGDRRPRGRGRSSATR